MPNNLGAESLRDTTLWKRLRDPWPQEPARSAAGFLAANLQPLCEEGANRMKSFPSLHPQFTLHDDTHLLRVTQLMGELIPEKVLRDVLSPVEIALLILSAHFHDQGMVLEAREFETLEANPHFMILPGNWTSGLDGA